jgi:hypothetical protein
MPADDLVLSVRQIANYGPTTSAIASDLLLIQRGGLGGPYLSINASDFVGTALSTPGGDMAIGGKLQVLSVQGGTAQFSNGAFGVLTAQKACIDNFSATWGCIGGSRIATAVDLAALAAATVTSFNGRQGAVCLGLQDIISAGGAPNFSPVFGGEPRAPTPAPWSNSTRLATTAYVTSAIGALTLNFAPLDSPDFTGVPTAPTPPLGSSDGTLATTAFVQSAIANSTAGVASFNTRTGIVTLTNADVTGAGGAVLNSPAFTGTPTAPTAAPGDVSTRIATTAFVMTESGFAPLASPGLTGVPTAPTPTPGTNTNQIATTAYVQSAITGISLGVVTFNGRSGAVTLVANDITAAGGAILASPAFTGTPTAPNPPPGDSSTRIATTAYVQSLAGFAPIASPAFTGVPTAPTAAPGNNTQQIATTAFVEAAIANSTAGVASFNGRTGAVTLQANDLSAAGGALLASPVFTGTPSAPTAALGVSTTQLATTAYVMNAASIAAPLMNGTAAVGVGMTWARSDHVHPSDTSKLSLSGGTMTGVLVVPANGSLAITGASGTSRSIIGQTGGSTRWLLQLGSGTAESGANVGSDFALLPYTDAGAASPYAPAMSIVRATSAVSFKTTLNLLATAAATNPTINLCNTAGTIQSGWYWSSSAANATWTYGATYFQLQSDGSFLIASGNAFKPGGGTWTAPSDERIKTVLGDYDRGLADVLALRPVTFVYKGNDTRSGDLATRIGADPNEPVPTVTAAPFPSSPHYQEALDGNEYVGLVAQELESVFPSMVTQRSAFIDGAAVSDLRDVNTSELIFALVNAVKTLAARVAALEAT